GDHEVRERGVFERLRHAERSRRAQLKRRPGCLVDLVYHDTFARDSCIEHIGAESRLHQEIMLWVAGCDPKGGITPWWRWSGERQRMQRLRHAGPGVNDLGFVQPPQLELGERRRMNSAGAGHVVETARIRCLPV